MTFIQLITTIIFGIVEGITEWLPVSSTGLILPCGATAIYEF